MHQSSNVSGFFGGLYDTYTPFIGIREEYHGPKKVANMKVGYFTRSLNSYEASMLDGEGVALPLSAWRLYNVLPLIDVATDESIELIGNVVELPSVDALMDAFVPPSVGLETGKLYGYDAGDIAELWRLAHSPEVTQGYREIAPLLQRELHRHNVPYKAQELLPYMSE